MRRQVVAIGIGVLLVVALAVVAVWRAGSQPTVDRGGVGGQTTTRGGGRAQGAATASIAGTIRDRAGGAIAGARVCAEAWPTVACATAAENGAYTLPGIPPGRYDINASARGYRPALRKPPLWIAAGESRAAIDIELDAGGLEVTGVVLDISGGSIVQALVRAGNEQHDVNRRGGWGAGVETNASGEFSLWLPPGNHSVIAVADGYAAATTDVDAPGHVVIRLIPASSISGIAVDPTGKPVADADVAAVAVNVDEHTRSAADGTFRISGLRPDRYSLIARTPDGYGRSAGSMTVGFGAHVEGVVVVVHPAARVTGRVLVEPQGHGCSNASVRLRDAEHDREIDLVTKPDGTARGDGILPGTYTVYPRCAGYASAEAYPPVVVDDRDVSDLVWRVSTGATVRGRVVRDGQGVPDARVRVGRATTTSRLDGSFELFGLPAGDSIVHARTLQNERAQLQQTLVAGKETNVELLVDRAAVIRGNVVDQRGAPVPHLPVSGAVNTGEPARSRTDGAGHFEMPVRPGTYHVGVGDDVMHPSAEQTVTVEAGREVMMRFVVQRAEGAIRGRVVDSAGQPVDDAFVEVFRPSMLDWVLPHATELTDTEGAFAFEHLDAGRYTVHARRKGGGDVRAQGVETGANITLQLPSTGSLAGSVDAESVILKLRDSERGFYREEEFYRTRGAFTVRDLPPGNYTIAAETPDGFGVATVELAAGEHKSGIRVDIDKLVPITGRIVEAGSRRPLAGFFTIARSTRAQLGIRVDAGNTAHASGADGRFRTRGPRGTVTISVHYPDLGESWCSPELARDVQGPIDLGDIALVRRRLAAGDKAGALGFTLVESFDESPTLEIATSTHSELRAGDVITAIDGIDVREAGECVRALLAVPAGRSLALTLARGADVRVVVR